MADTREKLIKLLCSVPCESELEGQLGSCPHRRYGKCGEVGRIHNCAVQKLADHLLANGVTVQRWIPVTERLPENEATVLVLAQRKSFDGKRNIPVVAMAFYTDGKHHTEESSYVWEDLTDYIEEMDAYMIPEGWWESVMYGEEFSAVDDFVTHWMPLPEPPKEGE